ncbi:MAG: CRISPR-associated endonuclease Cas2 [Peptostreptococcus porci]|nr:CRISPR-associated endonuclease Cas2 [Peptostreptococcus porci]MDY5479968.1 CRISPR-associated endonuclease Cas2 [Peptostreptococcus porci]
MSYRFMRVIVMFDLPSVTSEEKREYRNFRKYLIKNGFMMLQESVYCKLALNQNASTYIMNAVRKNKPKTGLIQMIAITEKQFSKMELVLGETNEEIINSEERVVVI